MTHVGMTHVGMSHVGMSHVAAAPSLNLRPSQRGAITSHEPARRLRDVLEGRKERHCLSHEGSETHKAKTVFYLELHLERQRDQSKRGRSVLHAQVARVQERRPAICACTQVTAAHAAKPQVWNME